MVMVDCNVRFRYASGGSRKESRKDNSRSVSSKRSKNSNAENNLNSSQSRAENELNGKSQLGNEAYCTPRKRARMGSTDSNDPTKTPNDRETTPTKDEEELAGSPLGKASPGVSDDGITENCGEAQADLPESPKREELPPSTHFYDPELVMHICEWPTASMEAQVRRLTRS